MVEGWQRIAQLIGSDAAVHGVAEAELPARVVSPALDPPVVEHGTVEARAGRDLRWRTPAAEMHVRQAVPDLTG